MALLFLLWSPRAHVGITFVRPPLLASMPHSKGMGLPCLPPLGTCQDYSLPSLGIFLQTLVKIILKLSSDSILKIFYQKDREA